jgi:peptidoglycan/LPS O-acetylase OafA/YrhL
VNPFVRLGSVSLGVYVMHPLVLGPLMLALGVHATVLTALLAAVLAIAGASALVHGYRSIRSR